MAGSPELRSKVLQLGDVLPDDVSSEDALNEETGRLDSTHLGDLPQSDEALNDNLRQQSNSFCSLSYVNRCGNYNETEEPPYIGLD